MFRAFADETRLRILHLLVGGETCVGDLVAILDLPQPTVSRHLLRLRRAGLVEGRTSGRWRYYRLSPAAGELHERLLACLSSCFETVPALEEDRDRAERVRREGGCCAAAPPPHAQAVSPSHAEAGAPDASSP